MAANTNARVTPKITVPVSGVSENDIPERSDWLAVVHAAMPPNRAVTINAIFNFLF